MVNLQNFSAMMVVCKSSDIQSFCSFFAELVSFEGSIFFLQLAIIIQDKKMCITHLVLLDPIFQLVILISKRLKSINNFSFKK